MGRSAKSLPSSLASAIRRQHPEDSWRMDGGKPPAKYPSAPQDSPCVSTPANPNKRGRKTWVGTISFDSETEARVYRRLLDAFRIVFAHGRVALAEDSHIEPDFVCARIVNDTDAPMPAMLLPGEFVASVSDAKGEWKDCRGGKKAHVEKVAATKYKWFREKFGADVKIET